MTRSALTRFLVPATVFLALPLAFGAPFTSHAQEEEAAIAVDADPTGNEPAALAEIDRCVSVQVGDTFDVDLVIEDVRDLLAWEIGLSFDPDVLAVSGQDVEQFQAANAGSDVFDASGQLPEGSGRHKLGAVDIADPPSPDSGSGVLARITFEAQGAGVSPISLASVDLDGDNTPDEGPFLRGQEGEIIGDDDGDTFFDGPATDAEIAVGEDCPEPEPVDEEESASEDGDDGTDYALWGAIAAGIAAVVIAGGAGFLYLRRRTAA